MYRLAALLSILGVAFAQTNTPSEFRKNFELGRSAAQQKDSIIKDASLAAFVQGIENQVAAAARVKPVAVQITRTPDWYAISSNGPLRLISGLFLRIENEAELVGLLAHFHAHAGSPCVLSAPAAGRRASERAATEIAIETLRRAGYDPASILDLLSKLSYEQPAWSQAISADDLLELRASFEKDTIPPEGYRVDSSAFVEEHAKAVTLARGAK